MDERLIERFNTKWMKDAASDCWLWTASLAGKGYGQIKLSGERRQTYAHRVSYMIHHGEIPAGRQVCHRCDNPKCVNPAHLFLGTSHDNHQDMMVKGRGKWGEMRGEGNPAAKLTDRAVTEILTLVKAGLSKRRVARIHGVSSPLITKITRGELWSHVTLNRELG